MTKLQTHERARTDRDYSEDRSRKTQRDVATGIRLGSDATAGRW